MISADDIWDFNGYLQNCTESQVHGVLAKEKKAGGEEYVALAEAELERRLRGKIERHSNR